MSLQKLSSLLRKNSINTIKRLSSSSNILNSGQPDIEIPKLSVNEVFFSKTENYETFTALECGITGRKYTFGDLRKKSNNLSKALRIKLGLKENDVIGIFLPNLPEYPVAVLGALQAGLIVTTFNPIYTKDEIARQLEDSSTKALITINELYGIACEACDLINKKLPIVTIKTKVGDSLFQGAIDFFEFLDNSIDVPDIEGRNSEEVALLPYSSGTTGLPKGVQLTNFNMVANLMQFSTEIHNVFEPTTTSHQDVVPGVLPMYHIYGMSVYCFFALSKIAKVVTMPKFTPDDFISLLKQHKPTVHYYVPPIVHFLTQHPMVTSEDLAPFRVISCGAAPLGASDEDRFLQKAKQNVHILQAYGMTETSPCITSTSITLKNKTNCSGSVGVPIANTLVKVIDPEDPTGTPLGPHTPGELLMKGPQVMKGYLNKPAETAQTFLDGWLRTGDMVYYNEDGVIFVTDRLKELIKVKGFQVPPAELEEVIRAFPNVADVAVIGIPHDLHGEVPRAFVVPEKGTSVVPKELESYVALKVAEYKKLRGGIEVVQSIPKNPSGKILRREIRDKYIKSQ